VVRESCQSGLVAVSLVERGHVDIPKVPYYRQGTGAHSLRGTWIFVTQNSFFQLIEGWRIMDSVLMDILFVLKIDCNEFDSTPININVTSHLDVRRVYNFKTYMKCKKFHFSSKLCTLVCYTITLLISLNKFKGMEIINLIIINLMIKLVKINGEIILLYIDRLFAFM